MKILAKTFRFDKGVLYVILLPEEPIASFIKYVTVEERDKYNEAVAYARAHPIDVHPDSVERVKQLIWEATTIFSGDEKLKQIAICQWQPTDLTEYNISRVRMEIKEWFKCRLDEMQCSEECHGNPYLKRKCSCCTVQEIACLIRR